MKKQLYIAVFAVAAMLCLPSFLSAQTTEGTDFWVTFLRADEDTNNNKKLSLSFSARETCTVTVENIFSGYRRTVNVEANSKNDIVLFEGKDPTNRSTDEAVCYSFKSEVVDTSAIHITSDKPISVYATNYKKASFDATNVLPTDALQSEYIVQCYTPSDHGGEQQGSHFAIVAVEDGTVVEYKPTVETNGDFGQFMNALNAWGADKVFEIYPEFERFRDYLTTGVLRTDTLKAGQVWYVWTGKGTNEQGHEHDLSGTHIKSNKKIAVFQGNPHTNLPYYKDYGAEIGDSSNPLGERDHLFSQAMPTATWGNTFAIISSSNRKRDVIRIMALNDGTEVRINGKVEHVFDFSKEEDAKQYFEFEIGEKEVSGGKSSKYYADRPEPLVVGTSCFIETSCPCAVHQFIVSHYWDGHDGNDGDPAMMWVNPIEQQIDQITFSTYKSDNGTSKHYVNVVTTPENAQNLTLDGANKAAEFKDVVGSNGAYQFAQLSLGSEATAHTLKGDANKGFIAYVYGFTENESYGYNAGGSAKILTQSITINGEVFTPDSENNLCGEDAINFTCQPDYEYEKIEWYFGDGTNELGNLEEVQHFYEATGVYEAYVLIYRKSSNLCVGQSAVDSIPITVTIGRYVFSIDDIDVPCPDDGKEYVGKIYYTNEGKVNLHGDNVLIEYNEATLAAGFKNDELVITDNYFQITIPSTAEPNTVYGIHMKIESDCGGTDTTMNFMLNYDKDVITQRYDYLLGLQAEYFNNNTLSNIQWYRTSDSTAIEGQVTANLNFYDLKNEYKDDTYYVCFTLNEGTVNETRTCACAKAFVENNDSVLFDDNQPGTFVAYQISSDRIYVNAKYEGDIDCYAEWINTSGNIYKSERFDLPNGGCTIPTPTENGLYLLRVTTDKKTRSFKFLIKH